MKTKIMKLVSLCMILTLVTGCGTAKLSNGKELVAKVSGKGLSADKLYDELKNRYSREILADLIDHTILDSKYPETDSLKTQVNSQIDSIKQQTGTGSPFLTAIKNQWGFNSEKELYDYLLLTARRNTAISDYLKDHLTNDQIKNYYDNETVGDIKASHILIKSKATDSMTSDEKAAKEKEALDKAKDIIKELKGGADFATLAKKYSEDTGSASKGGDLDYFNKGVMDAAFEQAAFALNKGEYTTTPVKSQFGYHIILKVDTKAKPKLEDVKDSIKTTLANRALTNDSTLAYKTLENIRKDSKLVIYDSNLKSQYDAYMQELETAK